MPINTPFCSEEGNHPRGGTWYTFGIDDGPRGSDIFVHGKYRDNQTHAFIKKVLVRNVFDGIVKCLDVIKL